MSQQGTEVVSLGLGMDEVVFDERGGEVVVNVETNKDDWSVRLDDSSAEDWLAITKGEDSFTLTAITNVVPVKFETTLTVRAGTEDNNTEVTLPITLNPWTSGRISFFSNPQELATKRVIIPQEGGDITIPVYTNREWEASAAESWVTFSYERDALIVSVEPANEVREAIITLTTTSGVDEGLTAECLAKQVGQPYILEVTIPEGGARMDAPIYGKVNVYIDWGDGSEPTTKDGLLYDYVQPRHDYLEGGVYELKIYGEAEGTNCTKVSRKYVTGIISYGELGFTNFQYVFAGMSIKELPDGYKEFLADAKSFYYSFAGTTLETIPADLFEGMSNLDLSCTFINCPNLTTIPATLFEGTSGIIGLPNTFRYCPGLTEIPETLFDPLTELRSTFCCFDGCKALTTVPARILSKCPELSEIRSMFRDCDNLRTVEQGFLATNTKITNAHGVFDGCIGLETVGTDFLAGSPNVNTVEIAFRGCTSLTGESPFSYVGSEKVHLYERADYPDDFTAPTSFTDCFKGCTGLSD